MERKTLQKFRRKMTKNCCGALSREREREREREGERGKFENFLKKMF